MYDPRLDQAIKDFVFERHNPDGSTIGRREFVNLGRQFEREVIAERFCKSGLQVFTLEEIVKIINGESV